jgi:hypothetical protein
VIKDFRQMRHKMVADGMFQTSIAYYMWKVIPHAPPSHTHLIISSDLTHSNSFMILRFASVDGIDTTGSQTLHHHHIWRLPYKTPPANNNPHQPIINCYLESLASPVPDLALIRERRCHLFPAVLRVILFLYVFLIF